MWLITRTLTQAIFLFLVVFTIPLAFDVGGRTCGLAFSLSLTGFYFFLSCARLATPSNSRIRATIVGIFGYTQWFTLLTLLIWSLNKFSVDGNNNTGWVQRTFNYKRAADTSSREWIFGRNGLLESGLIGGWDMLLRYAIPAFQIGEGFCSLLVIQAAGQITRWLVNRERGDSWMVRLLAILKPTTALLVCHDIVLRIITRHNVSPCILRLWKLILCSRSRC